MNKKPYVFHIFHDKTIARAKMSCNTIIGEYSFLYLNAKINSTWQTRQKVVVEIEGSTKSRIEIRILGHAIFFKIESEDENYQNNLVSFFQERVTTQFKPGFEVF